jgi:hypothetical protein
VKAITLLRLLSAAHLTIVGIMVCTRLQQSNRLYLLSYTPLKGLTFALDNQLVSGYMGAF